ncbi:shTK domain protein [Oesophagostomum dentatum]|uniref:ShTK domain protein n=1 Tax=Oesophagostomum dentatum TaxID=61180 RepID=A0A0B1SHA0_OESDE|nr:shTK domain protein [Oesophagostomum dentatum]
MDVVAAKQKESTNMPEDLIASDNEVQNIRQQSRLDSRRRKLDFDAGEESFLHSIDNVERILSDGVPTLKLSDFDEKKLDEVERTLEGSGNEKPDVKTFSIVYTSTDTSPYTSVELLTDEPEAVTPAGISCKDAHEYCPAWKSGQLCVTSPMFMYRFCRKTCEMCAGTL